MKDALPFGVGGGLVAIKTLLSRDPCVHANTAIEMIDAILKEHTAAPVQELQRYSPTGEGGMELDSLGAYIKLQDVATPPAQPAPVQDPVATVIKKGADRQWMSERLGSLPDGIYSLYTTPPAAPVQDQSMFDCGVQPRPLSHPLRAYHIAMSEGPLHYEWTDKPHRLVYDLIAAVRFYANRAAPVQEPVAWPMEEQPDGSIIPVDPSELPSDHFTHIVRQVCFGRHTFDSTRAAAEIGKAMP